MARGVDAQAKPSGRASDVGVQMAPGLGILGLPSVFR
jgi:hypothetical protein